MSVPYRAVRAKTFQRDTRLRKALEGIGGELRVHWACDIRREIRISPLLQAWFGERSMFCPYNRKFFNPREALYGGVTEAFKLSYKLSDEELESGGRVKIRSGDIVSLYPYIQAYCEFPGTAHPEFLTASQLAGGGCDWNLDLLTQYSPAIVYCLIMPPANLLYPTLPCRIRGKCMFVLCHKCGLENAREKCAHSDPKDRALLSVWTSVDLEVALKCGYQLLQVFSLMTWRAEPPTTELFRNHVMVSSSSGSIVGNHSFAVRCI